MAQLWTFGRDHLSMRGRAKCQSRKSIICITIEHLGLLAQADVEKVEFPRWWCAVNRIPSFFHVLHRFFFSTKGFGSYLHSYPRYGAFLLTTHRHTRFSQAIQVHGSHDRAASVNDGPMRLSSIISCCSQIYSHIHHVLCLRNCDGKIIRYYLLPPRLQPRTTSKCHVVSAPFTLGNQSNKKKCNVPTSVFNFTSKKKSAGSKDVIDHNLSL